MEAVPVITAINMARENAGKLGYEFRVPKQFPRDPKNEPTALELQVLKDLESKGLDEIIIREPDRIRYFKAIRLTQDCLFCHGDPKGAKDPMGGTKEGWKAGEIHGAFEINTSLEAAKKQTASAGWTAGLITLVILGPAHRRGLVVHHLRHPQAPGPHPGLRRRRGLGRSGGQARRGASPQSWPQSRTPSNPWSPSSREKCSRPTARPRKPPPRSATPRRPWTRPNSRRPRSRTC